jgi:hypothetical protein
MPSSYTAVGRLAIDRVTRHARNVGRVSGLAALPDIRRGSWNKFRPIRAALT